MMADAELSRLMKGTLSTGFGRLSIIVLGLAGLMITTRRLAPEDLGAFVLLRVIVTFLTQFSSLGVHLSVPRFIASAEDKKEKRRFVNTVIYFRILTILATSAIAVVAGQALLTLFGSSQYLDLVVFVPILLALESLGVLLVSILEGVFNFKLIGIVNLTSSISHFALILVFVLWLEQGVLGLVYASMISMTIACAFGYFSARIDNKLEFDLDLLKKMLVFGFPLHINYILSFIFMRIDTFMVATLLGPAEVALYEIARRIPDSLEQLYDAFRQVYFPVVSRLFALGKQNEVATMLNHATRWVSFLSILGALVAFVFGDEVIVLLFSETYLPSVPAFVLLMIGLNLTLIDYTLGYSLVAIGDSNKPPIINVAHTAISFTGYLILIPALGIVGAPLANLAGTAAVNPLNVLFLRRREVDVKIRGYLKPILIFGTFLIPLSLLSPDGFLQKISIVVLFVLASVFLSVITTGDVAAVSREAKLILPGYIRGSRSKRTKAR